MSKEELVYFALIGVRAEREKAWQQYLDASRSGNKEQRDCIGSIYTKLDEKELEIATMEVSDDEM